MSSVPDYFRGRHVLLTGGSSGIGLATATQLIAHGATVTLVARRQALLDEAKGKLGGTVHTLAVDVSREDDVSAKVAPHIAAHPVDMLINNAGIVMPGRFLELDPKHYRDNMEVNYFGSVYMCRAVLPQLVAKGAGHVLNVSSMAGVIGAYGYSAYAPSKFALFGFSEVLRAEMWPHKVRVSVCLPPDTDTPQLAFENQYKPAETKAITGSAGMMSATDVASIMLAGMAAGTFEIVPGFTAKAMLAGYRTAPTLGRWVMDQDQKKGMKT